MVAALQQSIHRPVLSFWCPPFSSSSPPGSSFYAAFLRRNRTFMNLSISLWPSAFLSSLLLALRTTLAPSFLSCVPRHFTSVPSSANPVLTLALFKFLLPFPPPRMPSGRRTQAPCHVCVTVLYFDRTYLYIQY